MKKTIYFFIAASITLYFGCNKQFQEEAFELPKKTNTENIASDKFKKAACTAKCSFGDCNASRAYTNCKCVLGFPRCTSRDVQSISFNENGEPSFNDIILETNSTENPNKTLAIEKFLTLISLIETDSLLIDNYDNYISLLDEYENFMIINFTEDEIATISQIK
jgi:hypothetical protein